MKKQNYIITSGWWCKGIDQIDGRKFLHGSDAIRERDFFNKWYESVNKYTNPEKIIIVDSASPIKPELPDDKRIEFISLNTNAGHSTNHIGHWCGYTRGVLLGMSYALACETDYWVYIEQDALLYGDNIIEEAISKMKKGIMFGSGKGTPQPLQQSFIIMRRDKILSFMKRLDLIKYKDGVVSPEIKFALATSNFIKYIPHSLFAESDNIIRRKIKSMICRGLNIFSSYDELPFGYGRSRPIEFNDQYFYFQHGSEKELERWSSKIQVHTI